MPSFSFFPSFHRALLTSHHHPPTKMATFECPPAPRMARRTLPTTASPLHQPWWPTLVVDNDQYEEPSLSPEVVPDLMEHFFVSFTGEVQPEVAHDLFPDNMFSGHIHPGFNHYDVWYDEVYPPTQPNTEIPLQSGLQLAFEEPFVPVQQHQLSSPAQIEQMLLAPSSPFPPASQADGQILQGQEGQQLFLVTHNNSRGDAIASPQNVRATMGDSPSYTVDEVNQETGFLHNANNHARFLIWMIREVEAERGRLPSLILSDTVDCLEQVRIDLPPCTGFH